MILHKKIVKAILANLSFLCHLKKLKHRWDGQIDRPRGSPIRTGLMVTPNVIEIQRFIHHNRQTMSKSKDDNVPITVAAVEGGGTTFCIAVAQLHADGAKITHRISIDSSHEDPQRTLFECATFLEGSKPPGGYHALGIATFGPVGLNPSQKTYGSILPSSPKKAWRNVNILKPLVKACQGKARKLAVKVDTDCNAPAWAEHELLNKEGIRISSLAYVTVGTGVGVGLVVNDVPVHGRMHPEGGHVPVHPLEGDTFPGYSWGINHSPFGGKHTVEGIASSVALTERLHHHGQGPRTTGDRNILSDLDDDHEIWDHAANAIANLCVTLLLTVSIEQIILGGGVLNRNGLMEKVRKQTVKLMNGYVELPDAMSELIHSSAWGDEAGLMGAIFLAQKAYQEEQQHDVNEATFVTKSFRFGYFSGVFTGAMLTTGIAMLVVVARRGGSSR
jgi:fructokinase